jgi:hypothetical protein
MKLRRSGVSGVFDARAGPTSRSAGRPQSPGTIADVDGAQMMIIQVGGFL